MHKRTQKEFEDEMKKYYGNQFEILSPYINNETKVKLKCNKCGSIIYKKPSKLITPSAHEGCYICHGKNWFKTTESFKQEVDDKYPGEYEILSEYVKARQKIKVRRIPCGHVYEITPDNLLRGKGCPRCGIKQSHFMDLTEEWLNSHKIVYEKEKRFKDCKNKKPLPFDYYIKKINLCIEVDGQFHYRMPYMDSKYREGKGSLNEIRKRDNIKTEYCESHGIRLLRLPYYDFDDDTYKYKLNNAIYTNTEVNNQIA